MAYHRSDFARSRWLRGGLHGSRQKPPSRPALHSRAEGSRGPRSHQRLMDPPPRSVVLDTNVFVAAGFNPGSHSARLVEAVRDGRLRMIWDDTTRAEIEQVMR